MNLDRLGATDHPHDVCGILAPAILPRTILQVIQQDVLDHHVHGKQLCICLQAAIHADINERHMGTGQ